MKIDVEPLADGDLMYKHVQRYVAFITKAQDDALRKAIVEHAQERSRELGEDVEVLFADEEKVNRIIDLGIREDYRETRGWKNEEE